MRGSVAGFAFVAMLPMSSREAKFADDSFTSGMYSSSAARARYLSRRLTVKSVGEVAQQKCNK